MAGYSKMATSTDEDSDSSSPKSEPGFRFSLKLRERLCKTKKKPSSFFDGNVVTIQVSLYLNLCMHATITTFFNDYSYLVMYLLILPTVIRLLFHSYDCICMT